MDLSCLVSGFWILVSQKDGPVGTCTLLARVKAGSFAVKASDPENWCSRQDFRPQPPRSKRGALYLELRELWKTLVLPRGLAPRTSAFAGRRARLLHFGSGYENWWGQRDLHPHRDLHRVGCCSYTMTPTGKETRNRNPETRRSRGPRTPLGFFVWTLVSGLWSLLQMAGAGFEPAHGRRMRPLPFLLATPL